MIRPSRLPLFLLAVVLFVACAVAFMGIDCGGDVGCMASKFAFGYLLIGLVVALTGAVAWFSRAPVTALRLTPLPVSPPISVPRKISARAPPILL
jgi:hypothetical protein